MAGFLENLFGKKTKEIVLLIDGPNIIRKSFNIDLKEVKDEVGKYGNIRVSKIYLDQYASDKLIEAMVNQGFEPTITTGDVDVTMAVEAMEHLLKSDVDIIALMTRDTDYIPVLRKAKLYGKQTMIIATDVAFSAALRNTADVVIILKGKGPTEHIKNQ
jgi:uncharacterized protein (TIGR00288 family)